MNTQTAVAVERGQSQVVKCWCGCGRDVDTSEGREYGYYRHVQGDVFYDIDCVEWVFWPDEPTNIEFVG